MVLSRETFLDIIADSDLLGSEIAAMMRKRTAANRMLEVIPKLQPADIGRIMPEFRTEQLQAGETVIRTGDEADRFFIILEGEGVVSRELSDGTSQELARLQAGRYFGEIGLLNRCPRNATVTISDAGPATLLSTDRDSFHRMLEGSHRAGSDLAEALLEQIAGL